ncbi:NAD(P)-dependent iron-only hydrogenase diaphorase component flavoprotein [Alkalithermobacter thermoalcaliphilus JW-YL-7 = DSM 7308]|uniref:NAD(P)-dependent iron-only hydrogenase diaphorase component flavoprotein n=1 Tax=Alkalithermobacter thermoalcaliphilus JW-YL-7 = DSM 7308 TaxID=1121328 RepID=A0A150FQG6_CLOPD|nr:NADH dehydrogenase (quinone) [[Clostridium] paradoxum JW-YL-7 = DSM 7308]SHK79882.1 NAD(P)-dependent iron-only hydrogenase diaphorase component flavoprotein [[Clostridium] paradoxum JW-YL-7 = DSM 7308]
MELTHIKSISDLKKLKDENFNNIKLRFKDYKIDHEINKYHILVCAGTGCNSSKSGIVREKLESEINKRKLNDNVKVFKTGCFGFCKLGPIIVVHPDRTFYTRVTPEDVDDIVENHLQNGNVVERLLYKSSRNDEIQRTIDELDFFNNQMRIALRNCGVINPEDINEYIAMDGYMALANILSNNIDPKEIIDQIKKSGLRGRGGGGFPTGLKWEYASLYKNEQKYVLCNADEGDPGAFMDRSILEGDPHSVIEAMAIAGYCIGANKGYVYVRAEYPIAVERLEIAIDQARKTGLLGKNILGSSFDFDLDIRLGAGAFVCGEETALIQSVMGFRGEPRPRPPFPAEVGLWEKPTLNNNVETYANIPIILLKGADWYSSIGTDDSKGTKVFALAGQINNTGLIEVPMGTTLKTIIYDIGGGINDNKQFKAVQSGGPSGGCIPADLLDTKIDFKSLTDIGSMMGSGGLIVMDESDCMVDIARFYLEFAQDESCGKCIPCRVGTKRLLEILEKITKGKGEMEDLKILEELSLNIKDSSLCGLGQTAPNPILSTLKYFKDEYISHVKEKRCPAGVCNDLLKIVISDEKCIACGICARICPVNAIEGENKKPPFHIRQDICIKCGACIPKCPVDAIYKR